MTTELYDRRLIVVLGPTASGKTSYALHLAQRQRGQGHEPEIVNADSRQLYKHLDIGTAKVRPDEMQGVPHHLISVLEPTEEATIAWYKREATRIIDAILARGHQPILVGGSMLYLSSIIDGLEPLPSADPALRKKLDEEYERDAGASLHARLASCDPESAASIPRQNKTYLIRAMELFETLGMPASESRRQSSCPYDLEIIGMEVPRSVLLRRINERLRRMFADGWVDEVRALRARGYAATDPAMESLGYREIMAALDGGIVDEPALVEEIARKTRRYAKRQMTWWRGDERIRWIRR